MHCRVRALLAGLLLVSGLALGAGELRGQVIRVLDGDTVIVLDEGRQRHTVRLAYIDAPEKGQHYADRSRTHLRERVRGRDVQVIWGKRDQYRRLVGVIFIDGQDINAEQVRHGWAWWYRRYASEQSPSSRRRYDAAESQARSERRGLWAQANPTPPWEWRKAQGH